MRQKDNARAGGRGAEEQHPDEDADRAEPRAAQAQPPGGAPEHRMVRAGLANSVLGHP